VLEPGALALELFDITVTLVARRLAAGCLGVEARFAMVTQLLPPHGQGRAVEALLPEQGRHLTSARAALGLGENAQLLFAGEPPPLATVVL